MEADGRERTEEAVSMDKADQALSVWRFYKAQESINTVRGEIEPECREITYRTIKATLYYN